MARHALGAGLLTPPNTLGAGLLTPPNTPTEGLPSRACIRKTAPQRGVARDAPEAVGEVASGYRASVARISLKNSSPRVSHSIGDDVRQPCSHVAPSLERVQRTVPGSASLSPDFSS